MDYSKAEAGKYTLQETTITKNTIMKNNHLRAQAYTNVLLSVNSWKLDDSWLTTVGICGAFAWSHSHYLHPLLSWYGNSLRIGLAVKKSDFTSGRG